MVSSDGAWALLKVLLVLVDLDSFLQAILYACEIPTEKTQMRCGGNQEVSVDKTSLLMSSLSTIFPSLSFDFTGHKRTLNQRIIRKYKASLAKLKVGLLRIGVSHWVTRECFLG